jgi:CRP-like cAMP-binding protein
MIKNLNLSEEVLAKYGTRIRVFEKGEYLARSGTMPKSLFYITSGTAKIVTINEDGVEYLHGYCDEGEMIGIGTYLCNYKFYNDFIAVEDMEVFEISLDNFEMMIAENPNISRNIMQYLAEIIEIKTITLTTVLGKSPREKILITLEKIKSLSLIQEDFLVPYTRQEMANFLGLRVETVIRTVKELEEEGRLRIEKGKIYY